MAAGEHSPSSGRLHRRLSPHRPIGRCPSTVRSGGGDASNSAKAPLAVRGRVGAAVCAPQGVAVDPARGGRAAAAASSRRRSPRRPRDGTAAPRLRPSANACGPHAVRASSVAPGGSREGVLVPGEPGPGANRAAGRRVERRSSRSRARARAGDVAAERGGQRLAAEAQAEHGHAGVVGRAQERDLARAIHGVRTARPTVGPERATRRARAGPATGPRRGARSSHLVAAPRAPPTPPAAPPARRPAARRRTARGAALPLDPERAAHERVDAAEVRVGARREPAGVDHVSRLAAAVKPRGPEAELAGVEVDRAVGERVGDPGRRGAGRRARGDGVEDVAAARRG